MGVARLGTFDYSNTRMSADGIHKVGTLGIAHKSSQFPIATAVRYQEERLRSFSQTPKTISVTGPGKSVVDLATSIYQFVPFTYRVE